VNWVDISTVIIIAFIYISPALTILKFGLTGVSAEKNTEA